MEHILSALCIYSIPASLLMPCASFKATNCTVPKHVLSVSSPSYNVSLQKHVRVLAALDRYAEDKRRAREQYEAIGKLLDAQVASNSQRNAEEAAQQQQEIDALKARWAADDEAARQAEDSARARQQQLNLEVKEFNRCCTKHDKSLCLVMGL